jgi:hypothetical protein
MKSILAEAGIENSVLFSMIYLAILELGSRAVALTIVFQSPAFLAQPTYKWRPEMRIFATG